MCVWNILRAPFSSHPLRIWASVTFTFVSNCISIRINQKQSSSSDPSIYQNLPRKMSLSQEIDHYIKESIDHILGLPISTKTLELKLLASEAKNQSLEAQCLSLQSKLNQHILATNSAKVLPFLFLFLYVGYWIHLYVHYYVLRRKPN